MTHVRNVSMLSQGITVYNGRHKFRRADRGRGPSRAAPFHPAKRRCGRYAAGGEDEDGDGEGEDGRGEGGWNVKDGDGDDRDGEGDGDGFGEGLGDGLGLGLGLGGGFDEGKVADTAGAGSTAGGVVAVSACQRRGGHRDLG